MTGSQFLDQQAIPHTTAWHLWRNVTMLAVIATSAMCIAYVQLRRMKKLK